MWPITRYHWTNVWDPADFGVVWRPWYEQYGQLRYPGYYQIHAFIPTAGDSTKTKTSNARYEVHHGYYNHLTTIVPVNQTAYSDQWMPLGTYWLWPWQMGGYVSMYDYTGESSGSRKIVADGMKFTASVVHLPDVRNSGGWTSSIVIRNNKTSSAQVAINYYNTNGGRVSYQTTTVAGNGSTTRTPPSGFTGSAVVVSSEDMSVVVENQYGSQTYAYNGVSASNGDLAFRTGRTIYTPLSIARYGNWHTTLVVQNAGSSYADVAITYRNPSGSSRGTFYSWNIPPNGVRTFDANAHLGSSFTGSAVVTSDQEIAVIVRESDGSMVGAYNGASAGAITTYVPLVLKGYSDWTTGFQIQNVDSQGATATITYYNSNGGMAGTQPISIPGNGNLWVVPSVAGPWSGVAVVTGNRNLAVEVDEYNGGSGDLESYNGLSLATPTAYLPDVRDSATWYTGLVIQNVSGSWSNVRLSVNGVTSWQGWIQGHGWRSVRPNGTGSAVVESLYGQGLVVQVDNYWAASGDRLMSYMGDNR